MSFNLIDDDEIVRERVAKQKAIIIIEDMQRI
jgi:hypothetical protein